MQIDTQTITTIQACHTPQTGSPTRAAQVKGFLWHFLQMVLVMNAGMMVYHMLYAALAGPLGVSAVL